MFRKKPSPKKAVNTIEDTKVDELASQSLKVSQALLQLANVVKEIDKNIRVVLEGMAMNRFLIEDILKNKFHLSTPEIDILFQEAKQRYQETEKKG